MKATSILAALIFLTPPLILKATDFYVVPSPASKGNGSLEKPWDLQTALNQPSDVKPGDTILLRKGVHRRSDRPTKFVSNLRGRPEAPITVRQYPGERAIIDGNLCQIKGGWVTYWGFEILNSNTNRYTLEAGPFPQRWWVKYGGKDVDLCVSGLDLQAPNIKAINLIVHDCIGGGFGVNVGSQNTEVYGCLSYYNGWQGSDRGHGHGIYAQNAAPHFKKIKDNFVFSNLGLGMQYTGSGSSPTADNLHLEGTAFFMNGNLAFAHQANLLIGAYEGMGQNALIVSNCIYDTRGTMSDCNIGYEGGLTNPVVRDNYFGTSVFFGPTYNLTLSGNVFASTTYNLDRNRYPSNTYAKPQTNKVFVRPNLYEPGRANIIIYNWEKLDRVLVDVSHIGLAMGESFELHNAGNYFGDIFWGTYDGKPIPIPMTGHTPAKPIGVNLPPPPNTFPEFGAFVIMKTARAAQPSAR